MKIFQPNKLARGYHSQHLNLYYQNYNRVDGIQTIGKRSSQFHRAVIYSKCQIGVFLIRVSVIILRLLKIVAFVDYDIIEICLVSLEIYNI